MGLKPVLRRLALVPILCVGPLYGIAVAGVLPPRGSFAVHADEVDGVAVPVLSIFLFSTILWPHGYLYAGFQSDWLVKRCLVAIFLANIVCAPIRVLIEQLSGCSMITNVFFMVRQPVAITASLG
jgi:hypothetical protein